MAKEKKNRPRRQEDQPTAQTMAKDLLEAQAQLSDPEVSEERKVEIQAEVTEMLKSRAGAEAVAAAVSPEAVEKVPAKKDKPAKVEGWKNVLKMRALLPQLIEAYEAGGMEPKAAEKQAEADLKALRKSRNQREFDRLIKLADLEDTKWYSDLWHGTSWLEIAVVVAVLAAVIAAVMWIMRSSSTEETIVVGAAA